MATSDEKVLLQQAYYAQTAATYDTMHPEERDEHAFAMHVLLGLLDFYDIKSVLDVGAGTGRATLFFKTRRPDIAVTGIEPVAELRAIGHQKGLSIEELRDGDALALPFATDSIDLVCAFGVLHHIEKPELAIAEMLRVSRKAIFLSDSNNFAQGSVASKSIKQLINAVGLWPLANWIKTGGKGYSISEGDGLAYSYSLFNNYEQIKRACQSVHLVNTHDGGRSPYHSANHVALLGIKS
ncbi:MAG: methyltransferase domain-containing protein [Pseudomonadota bacterium]